MNTEEKEPMSRSREEDSAQERRKRRTLERRQQSIRNHRIVRLAVQIISLVLMPSAFASGFAGVKSIFSHIGGGEPLVWDGDVKILLFLLLYTVVFGRFFCGYLCGLGSIGDWIHALFIPVWKKLTGSEDEPAMPEEIVIYLQKLKYLVLAGCLIFIVYYGGMPKGDLFDVFSRLAAFGSISPEWAFGVIILITAAVGSLIQERFFCQFLCPFGALFSLLPILPVAQYERKAKTGKAETPAVIECGALLDLEADSDRSGECYGCERCAAACPNNTILRGEDAVFHNDAVNVIVRALIFAAAGAFLGIGVFA